MGNFFKKNISYIRLLYPIILVIIVICNLINLQFVSSQTEFVMKVLYFVIEILYVVSLYFFNMDEIDLVVLVFVALFTIFSPIKYDPLILIAILPAFYKKRFKSFASVLVLCWFAFVLFIGVAKMFFLLLIGGFGAETNITSTYSPDQKHRVDVVDFDQGALGGDTNIRLFSVYFGTLEKFEKNIYHGWGDRPSVKWINNETVEVNGSIKLNIKNSEMYENEPRRY